MGSTTCEQFSHSLKVVKKKVIVWERERLINRVAQIDGVEKSLEELGLANPHCLFNQDDLKISNFWKQKYQIAIR